MGRFYTVDEINPNLKKLSDNYQKIREEFNDNKDRLTWTNWHGDNCYTSISKSPYDGWQVAALYLEYKNFIVNNIDSYKEAYNTEVHVDEDKNIISSDNTKVLPLLTDLAYESGLTTRVGISLLVPGKDIDWHVDNDPYDDEYITIRGLWGIDVNPTDDEHSFLAIHVDGNTSIQHFENNKFIFFWGRTTHMVYNSLSTPRYCLCFDQKVKIDNLL